MTNPAQPAQDAPERLKLTRFADGFICDAPSPSWATANCRGGTIEYIRADLARAHGTEAGDWPESEATKEDLEAGLSLSVEQARKGQLSEG